MDCTFKIIAFHPRFFNGIMTIHHEVGPGLSITDCIQFNIKYSPSFFKDSVRCKRILKGKYNSVLDRKLKNGYNTPAV